MSSPHPASENTLASESILQVDFEIEIFTPHVLYPSLHDFLEKLDSAEPHRGWSKLFLVPLTRLGVRHLDDMELVSPEYLYILYKLPPIIVMDFFSRIHDTIQTIHHARPLVEVKNHGQNVLGYVHIESAYTCHHPPTVTEFVPLHDILYIFLSPDRAPYLSIDEFLTSPDRHLDLSAFIPDSSFS